jgi:hypothetical protein
MDINNLFCKFGVDEDSNLFLILTYEDGSLLFQVPVYNLFSRSKNVKDNIQKLFERLQDYEKDIGLIILDRDVKDGFTEELFRWFLEGHLKKFTLKTKFEDILEYL